MQLQGKSKDIRNSALCYPKICSPLSTTIDLDRYPHLQELALADESLTNDSALDIDILICSDYYFDIILEKAFHQIQLNPEWFDDISKEQPEIVQYQFCRLVFVLTPSPAILSSLIQHHLELNKEKEPEITSLLQDSFYVDDFVGGSSDDCQALEIYEKSRKIMKDGGFVLRKWTSNSKGFRQRVAIHQQTTRPREQDLN